MKILDINRWSRKQHYNHFNSLADPYFGVVIPFDVTNAYETCKIKNISFFARYLHDCMRAINKVENFKLRIIDDQVIAYNVIHASATIMRSNNTFGFSFIKFSEELDIFNNNIQLEKERIEDTGDLFPPTNSLDCVHCSATPWLNFVGHKEPISGKKESVPKIAFGKMTTMSEKLMMNVSVDVNHALVDGYHVGLFSEKFQEFLNE